VSPDACLGPLWEPLVRRTSSVSDDLTMAWRRRPDSGVRAEPAYGISDPTLRPNRRAQWRHSGRSSSPASMAWRTISARVAARSLVMTWARWLSTVRTLTTSAAAIS
jgi:hypothetical protein